MTPRAFLRALSVAGALAAGQAPGVVASGVVASMSGCAHVHEQPPPAAAVPPTKPDHEHAAETGLTIASTPQGLLREGAERKVQVRLQEKGFLPAGQPNGRLDLETRQALRGYQKSEGLPATGLPSYETVRHLGLSLDSIFLTVTPVAPAAERSKTARKE